MRIVRFLGDDGHAALGEPHPDGSATLLLDVCGVLEQGQQQRAIKAMLNGRRALIADDDEGIRNAVGEVCRKLGCECVLCSEGGQAMAALEREPIHLVVSDIVMPDHDGYEVFAAAKAKDQNLPVVLITGFGYDPGHKLVRASERGLEGVLFKPFTPQQLVEKIAAAVRPTSTCACGTLVRTRDRCRVGSVHAPLRPRDIFVEQQPGPGQAFPPGGMEFVVRPSSTVQDPLMPVRLPVGDGWLVRTEGRLAVVLATRLTPAATAKDAVLGYTLAANITASRDGERADLLVGGMAFDTFCPLGPVLITPESLPSGDCVITTSVNGKANRRIIIKDVASRVEAALGRLGRHMTLNEGTVVLLAGTDDAPPQPDVILHAGDRVSVEMEGIGKLENPIVFG